MGIATPGIRKLIVLAVAVPVLAALAVACSSPPARAQHLSAACASGRRLALTFDDGPNPPYTELLLEILVNAGARATFFDEGQAVEAHPDIVRREAADGMAIGSHSYSHSADLASMSSADFSADLDRADASLRAVLGTAPLLYRSPYGHTSDTMLRALRSAGYVSIGWDVDSADWSDATVDEVVSNVLEQVHPGAIVLMHDGGLGGGNPNRQTTLAALPRILVGLRTAGYDLVTVPELTGLPDSRSTSGGDAPRATCSAS